LFSSKKNKKKTKIKKKDRSRLPPTTLLSVYRFLRTDILPGFIKSLQMAKKKKKKKKKEKRKKLSVAPECKKVTQIPQK
jgi:uncharacterized membrane protein